MVPRPWRTHTLVTLVYSQACTHCKRLSPKSRPKTASESKEADAGCKAEDKFGPAAKPALPFTDITNSPRTAAEPKAPRGDHKGAKGCGLPRVGMSFLQPRAGRRPKPRGGGTARVSPRGGGSTPRLPTRSHSSAASTTGTTSTTASTTAGTTAGAASGQPEMAKVEVTMDAMRVRLCEVEALLRIPLDDSEAIEVVRGRTRASLRFLVALRDLATESRLLQGAVFQELLAGDRCKSEGHLRRSKRVGANEAAVAQAIAKNGDVREFADQATNLINLVRVKIEDDNDLALAGKTLQDIEGFLHNLRQLAAKTSSDEFELLLQLQEA